MDPTEKLKADVEFWRDAYEKTEVANKKLTTECAELKSELSDRRAKLEASRTVGDDMRNELSEAKRWLNLLADHVSGRDGMLQKSRTFCAVCEGSGLCVLKGVNEFLAQDGAKEAA